MGTAVDPPLPFRKRHSFSTTTGFLVVLMCAVLRLGMCEPLLPCHPYLQPDSVSSEVEFYEIPFFLKAEHSVDWDNEVSAILSVTPERLDKVVAFAQHWKGPISAAVYVINSSDDFSHIFQMHADHIELRQYVDIHLVYPNQVDDFPVNAVRNVAWKHSRTEILFFMDANFVTSPLLHDALKSRLGWLKQKFDEQRAIFIVPAFQPVSDEVDTSVTTLSSGWSFESKSLPQSLVPNSKAELVDMWNAKKLTFMHPYFAPGHRATNFEKWLSGNEIYSVQHEEYFEPYIIARRDIPIYDVRFRYRGCNKSQLFWELQRIGYKFWVLNENIVPGAFIVHVCDKVSRPGTFTKAHDYCKLMPTFKQQVDAKLSKGGYDADVQPARRNISCPDRAEASAVARFTSGLNSLGDTGSGHGSDHVLNRLEHERMAIRLEDTQKKLQQVKWREKSVQKERDACETQLKQCHVADDQASVATLEVELSAIVEEKDAAAKALEERIRILNARVSTMSTQIVHRLCRLFVNGSGFMYALNQWSVPESLQNLCGHGASLHDDNESGQLRALHEVDASLKHIHEKWMDFDTIPPGLDDSDDAMLRSFVEWSRNHMKPEHLRWSYRRLSAVGKEEYDRDLQSYQYGLYAVTFLLIIINVAVPTLRWLSRRNSIAYRMFNPRKTVKTEYLAIDHRV